MTTYTNEQFPPEKIRTIIAKAEGLFLLNLLECRLHRLTDLLLLGAGVTSHHSGISLGASSSLPKPVCRTVAVV